MTRLLVLSLVVCLAHGRSQDQQASKPKTQTEQPEFFDKPQFVVSGVTDYTYRGGHGSDSGLRSTEELTKATGSLSSSSSVDSMPLSEAATREKPLRESVAREPAKAELHHQLADVEEQLGNALDAVYEYQRAAELNPSESYLFDWGAELLRHKAGEPAIEIFTQGSHLFPDSVRMRLGLAVAFQLRGDYEQAARHFFVAADLHPHDPEPYLFLGKVQAREITGSAGYLERLARFASLEPNNAWANYYYAACLWQLRSNSDDRATMNRVKLLAERAVKLDGHLASAYLLLGTLDFEQKDLPEAILMYRKTIEISPETEEAHYRLAEAYELTGEKVKAQDERAIYKELSAKSAQETERERKELQQFVFTLQNKKSSSEK